MTFLEAISRVETALTALGLCDRWGEPLEGIVASGVVALAVGHPWDSLVDAMYAWKITPDEYCARMLRLTEEFSRRRFSSRVGDLLLGLKLDQIELDLIPRKTET